MLKYNIIINRNITFNIGRKSILLKFYLKFKIKNSRDFEDNVFIIFYNDSITSIQFLNLQFIFNI